MKAEGVTRGKLCYQIFPIIAILIIAGIVYECLPNRTKSFQVQSALQDGEKIEVNATLQSKWPWSIPERLIALDVTIAGKAIPIPKTFYYGIGSFDVNKVPLVDEWKGYPEIIMLGRPRGELNKASWWFMNNSFSALISEKQHHFQISYHADSSTPMKRQDAIATTKSGDVLILANNIAIRNVPAKRKVK